jgi:hypothetical protein
MYLQVSLAVKFRAFFITFATVKENWSLPIPFPLPTVPISRPTLLDYHQHGIDLTLTLSPAL